MMMGVVGDGSVSWTVLLFPEALSVGVCVLGGGGGSGLACALKDTPYKRRKSV